MGEKLNCLSCVLIKKMVFKIKIVNFFSFSDFTSHCQIQSISCILKQTQCFSCLRKINKLMIIYTRSGVRNPFSLSKIQILQLVN